MDTAVPSSCRTPWFNEETAFSLVRSIILPSYNDMIGVRVAHRRLRLQGLPRHRQGCLLKWKANIDAHDHWESTMSHAG
jgi:hypothetical protein